ncbi:MAG: DMT family transporter [Alphaproteobacteria bacterium]
MSGATDNIYVRGMAYAFFAYLTVAAGDALTKEILQTHSVFYALFYTNIIMIAGLLVIAPFCGGYKALINTSKPRLHIARAFIFLGVALSFLYAISNMGIAQTYTLYLTQPFILVILAHFITKEMIGPHRIISIILSFLGVLVVLRPGFIPLEPAALSALLCAFLFACGNILVKFMDKNDHWMTFVFYIMLVQTPLVGLYLVFSGGFAPLYPAIDLWGWFVGAGFFYIFALALFPLALQRIDAAMFGALEYTVLLWGTIFGYFLFSEVPDIWTISGAGIIVASGLYLVYRETKAGHRIKET